MLATASAATLSFSNMHAGFLLQEKSLQEENKVLQKEVGC